MIYRGASQASVASLVGLLLLAGAPAFGAEDCSGSTSRIGDWCIDNGVHPPAEFFAATFVCDGQGMRVCPVEALLVCDLLQPASSTCSISTDDPTQQLWTGSYSATFDTSFFLGLVVYRGDDIAQAGSIGELHPFYCCKLCALPLPEVVDLRWLDGDDLAWQAVGGLLYDVLRGDLAELRSTGGGAADLCLACDHTAAQITDPSPDPDPSGGWFYLVRVTDLCGKGTYGASSAGTERQTLACPQTPGAGSGCP